MWEDMKDNEFMGIPVSQVALIKRIIDMKFNGDPKRFLDYLENETAEIQSVRGQLAILDSKLRRIRDIVS